jgi:hypothetical protein
MNHFIVVEETNNFAYVVDRCVRLELRVWPICHPLAAHRPRVHMNGEDHKNLELMGAPER